MPAWSGDGARLFYRTPSNRGLAFVSVATHPSFSVGDAVTLPIDGLLSDAGYDVLPDGRFVVPVAASRSGLSTARPIQQIGVLLNWFEDGKRRARLYQ